MVKFVSIILCTYKGASKGIDKCLNSILNLNYPLKYFELIVVNDASTDNTEELIKDYKKKFVKKKIIFKYIKNKKNLQLYGSKQKGFNMRNKNSEVICVTDDDCEVDKNWLNYLCKHYDDKKVGSVGGFIDSKNDKTILERFAKNSKNNILSNPVNARFFHGANCSYSVQSLLKIGGFNPNIISGGDADVSFKLKKERYKLIYESEAIVYHQHRVSLKNLWKQFFKYGKGDFQLIKEYKEARFSKKEMIIFLLSSILQLPFRSSVFLFKKDSLLYFFTPFLNILKSIAWYWGYFVGFIDDKF